MKLHTMMWAKAVILATVSLGLGTSFLMASSSLGGPPGRSDVVKWRALPRTNRPLVIKSKSPGATEAPLPPRPTPTFIWNTPGDCFAIPTPESAPDGTPPLLTQKKSGSEAIDRPEKNLIQNTLRANLPPSGRSAPVVREYIVEGHPALSANPKSTLRYDSVLTEKQKAILRERAEALSLSPEDYEALLSPDEKERLETLLAEKQPTLTSGE